MPDLAHRPYDELQSVMSAARDDITTGYAEFGAALQEMRDGKVYREGGYDTFEAYCRAEWGMSKTNANRLISAGGVRQELQEMTPMGVTTLPETERVARPLTTIKDKTERVETWAEAVETAPDGKVTAKHVKAVVQKRTKVKSKQKRGTRKGSDLLMAGLMSVRESVIELMTVTPPNKGRVSDVVREIKRVRTALDELEDRILQWR